MRPFRRTLVASPALDAVRAASSDVEVMLVTILDAILARFERHAGRYPFVDTKLSTLTGEDFPEPAEETIDFRGRSCVFAWIQGRGLEALAGHARWLRECSVLDDAEKADRAARTAAMAAAVLDRMETIRAKNGGRLFFTMTPEGDPFDMGDDGRRRPVALGGGPRSVSDLFYAKGMLAAAALLGRREQSAEALRLFRETLADVEADRLVADAIAFDPRNRVRPAPGQLLHGPRMLALGGCALAAEVTGDDAWLDAGARLVRFILDHHANTGQFGELQPYDFFEARDASGRQWTEESGAVRSDPGHSLEFVGFAAKLMLLVRGAAATPERRELLARGRETLPKLFLRNFRNGLNPRIGGICKAFDLASRRPLNDHMPWWNLPETMRAAAELVVLAPDAPERAEILSALASCHNAFFTRFVNPRANLMAYQTIDADGRPVDVVPATPDADPGYHTGLSLIDALRCLGE